MKKKTHYRILSNLKTSRRGQECFIQILVVRGGTEYGEHLSGTYDP